MASEVVEQIAARDSQAPKGIVSVRPALLYGLRLSASACLALFVAFWFQLEDAHWAATSACLVAQPALGASIRKGQFRAIGTIVGGIAIVLITAAFPQDHVGFLLSLTLWGAFCGFVAALLPNFAGYAAALAGYTAAVVFAGIVANPQNVFMISVWRVTEIGIGIFSAVIVHSLTDFGDARVRLARALSELGVTIASGIRETFAKGAEDSRMRSTRRALIGRAIALDATVDQVLGEPSHLRHCSAQLRAVFETLFCALAAWRGIANHLGIMATESRKRLVAALLPAMSPLADRASWSDPAAIQRLCSQGVCRANELPTRDTSSRVLVDGCLRVFRAFDTIAGGLLLMTSPGTRLNARGSTKIYVPDPLPGMLDALRVTAALATAELVWITTSWPDAPTMIVFTAVSVMLFARQSDAAYSSALDFALGCALALFLAAILLLAVLPAMHHGGFLELAAALALTLLPLATLAAGSWHKAVFVAAAGNLIPILAIENETNFDGLRLLNVGLAVIAGSATSMLFFRLLPPLTPETRIRRLLTLTLRDLRRLLRGERRFSQEGWLALLSRRLAALPSQTSLEQEADLLAALSVGQACLALLTEETDDPDRSALDHALACLAAGNVRRARDGLVRFAHAHSGRQAVSVVQHRIDAEVQATLIADALRRHATFFSARE